MTAYLQQLFQFGFYKKSQGRIARQVTLIALAVVVALGAWSLSSWMQVSQGFNQTTAVLTAMGVFAAGFWASFRLVHLPQFADFLISVEAEMNKVSWPAKGELWRASIVVILTIFVLAAVLFLYDLIWQWLLGLILK